MTHNKALKLLYISNGIFVFGANLLGPLYALFASKFDANILSISGSWAVYMLSATLFSIPIAKLGDKFKETEYLLALGFFVRASAWIGYVFVPNFQVFLAIQVLLGLGQALGNPSFNTLMAKHTDRKEQVREYSVWEIIQEVSLTLATVIGGFIVYEWGFEALFIIMAILAILSTILILKAPRKLL